MFNRRYRLKEIISKTGVEEKDKEDFLGKICYPAYFKVGENGWFLCETDGCTYAPDRIRTSGVEKIEWNCTDFTVETENTIYKFMQIEN